LTQAAIERIFKDRLMRAIQSRAYQDRAVKFFGKSKAKRLLMTGPTGSGKTVIVARIIRQWIRQGKRVLVIVHRKELAVQMYEQLIRAGMKPSEVGVLMGTDAMSDAGKKRVRPEAPVQVCGIQTLIARDERPEADLVVVDEAHRIMADSYQSLLSDYPKARHLGLTATPIRFDGRGLADFYDELYVIEKPSKLVADGFLVEPKAFTVPEDKRPILKGLRLSDGDYSTRQLEARVNKKSLVGTIVAEIQRHAMNRQTVVFAVGIAHAKHILKQLRRAKFRAEILTGETPQAERDRILKDFETKRIQIIVNCGVLTEGWDMPICKCVVLARPTRSLTLYLQMVGRIERPYGNLRPILLDHVGVCLKRGFGLPTDDKDWKLVSSREPGNGFSDVLRKSCPDCDHVMPSACLECPDCGYVFQEPERVLDETTDRLIEFEAFRRRSESFVKTRPDILKTNPNWVEELVKAYGQAI
jgi:DNA repair protein RadD